jgi:hypothetical protein
MTELCDIAALPAAERDAQYATLRGWSLVVRDGGALSVVEPSTSAVHTRFALLHYVDTERAILDCAADDAIGALRGVRSVRLVPLEDGALSASVVYDGVTVPTAALPLAARTRVDTLPSVFALLSFVSV